MGAPRYSISWNLGSRCSFRRVLGAPDTVEVRATLGHWFWRQEVVRTVRFHRDRDIWSWGNGLVLELAPEWVWKSLEVALGPNQDLAEHIRLLNQMDDVVDALAAATVKKD